MSIDKLKNLRKSTQRENDARHNLIQIMESYKKVRTNLMFALANKKDDEAKVVMITSAEPNEGKTTTAINVAASFAELNLRVLLVEADLRRPRVERYIMRDTENGDFKHSKGLSDVLGGFCSLEDAIKRPDMCSFDCLFSGTIPPNPSELLMMDKMKDIFEELSEHYDYIFIDTPPIGVVSETLYLTQHATGIVLVIKQNLTNYKKIDKAIADLKFGNAEILGFVLNGSSKSQKDKYYKLPYYYGE